jgi:selenocysteine lyase/cysteine desulfurase
LAHAAKALVFVDAVHFAPHSLVDVKAIGCDFLGCSAYKFYGPHIGVLWSRREVLESLDVPKLEPAPNEVPEKLETGTQNHEGIVGAGAAVNYLASLAGNGHAARRDALAATFAELHARGAVLFETLWSGLAGIRGVTLYGLPPGRERTPTVAFTVAGTPSDAVAVAMAEKGLFVSHGDFYAATVIERLGVGSAGVVRVGCSVYTSPAEVERVLRAVAEIARR